MARFSLVIPTLCRADTLEHALTTLLAQSHADIEIVVQNNGNDPATRNVVDSMGDPRLQHFSTDEVLPMIENWERALTHSTGDFVTFVGDDDGLLPDACDIAASIFDAEPMEILSWAPFLYLWPEYWDERRRNRLQATVSFEFGVRAEASRPLLERFYDFGVHYSKLPMLYNSFVGRSLIDRVKGRHGRYFFGSLPDVTSGIINAAFSETFLFSTRALSVTGLSHHSTGHRYTRAATRVTPEERARDFPDMDVESSPGSNLELLIANEMRFMKDHVLNETTPLMLNEPALVRAMAAAINDSPSRYDETRSLILERARRLDISEEELVIPSRAAHAPAPEDGVHVLGPYEIMFVLDGNAIALRTIADAVSLSAQLVPGSAVMVRAEQAVARGRVPILSVEPLALTRNSVGTGALVAGWGEPEPWGTWAVERESTLRLEIPRDADGETVRLGLRYRTIPFPDHTPRVVSCVVDGMSLQEWDFLGDNAQGELVITIPEAMASGVVDVVLVNANARSPDELGIGPDQRRLGIGVEQIRLLP